eukprot:CAMPEP_0182430758 /NCGR_PEP_ID=MMETSP1167-20130531/43106_1 /TAXON_ID=2988 /ORGANISM="Mallomonas Sp, Strain CCMP3275" /LENGTH=1258 /DNA_ID=CAMNT_0024616217 /DNA_START=101 /DNA_END=3877 /DNA_ORIENTATION=-
MDESPQTSYQQYSSGDKNDFSRSNTEYSRHFLTDKSRTTFDPKSSSHDQDRSQADRGSSDTTSEFLEETDNRVVGNEISTLFDRAFSYSKLELDKLVDGNIQSSRVAAPRSSPFGTPFGFKGTLLAVSDQSNQNALIQELKTALKTLMEEVKHLRENCIEIENKYKDITNSAADELQKSMNILYKLQMKTASLDESERIQKKLSRDILSLRDRLAKKEKERRLIEEEVLEREKEIRAQNTELVTLRSMLGSNRNGGDDGYNRSNLDAKIESQLRMDLSNAEDRIHELDTQLIQKKDENARLHSEVMSLNIQVAGQLEERMRQVRELEDGLKRDLQQSQERVQVLEDTNKSLTEELTVRKEEVEASHTEISEMKLALSRLQERLTKVLEAKQTGGAANTAELLMVRDQLVQATQREEKERQGRMEAQKKLSEAEKQWDNAAELFEANAINNQRQLQEITQMRNQLQEDLISKDAKSEELQLKIVSLEGKIAEFQGQIGTIKQESEIGLRREFEEMKAKLDEEYQEKLDDLEDEYQVRGGEMEKSNAELSTKIVELEAQLVAHREEGEKANESLLEELKKKLDDEYLEKLDEIEDDYQEKIVTLEKANSELTMKITELETEMASHKTDSQTISAAELEELKATLEEDNQEKLDELEDEYSVKFTAMEQTNSTLEARIAELQAQVLVHQGSADAGKFTEEDVEAMRAKLDEEYSEKLDEVEDEYHVKMTALEQTNAELGTKITALEATIAALTAQLAASDQSEELEKLQEKLDEEFLEKLEEIEETHQKKVAELEAEKVTLQAKVTEVETELLAVLEESESVKEQKMKEAIEKIEDDFNDKLDDLVVEHQVKLEQMEKKHAQELEEEEEKAMDLELKCLEANATCRKLRNQIHEMRGNIRVFARIRPLLNRSEGTCLEPQSDGISLQIARTRDDSAGKDDAEHDFTFDGVFPSEMTQAKLFTEVSEFVQSALDGYRVCLFGYGQTGSGKTHTLLGGSNDNRGIIPRAMEQVAEYKRTMGEMGWTYQMQVSYVEIYNEKCYDLLRASENVENGPELKIQYQNDIPFLPDATMTVVDPNDREQLEKIIAKAASRRATGKTAMNEHSSRSHAIFNLHLTGSNSLTNKVLEGQLSLVDLAGSERVKNSKVTGSALKEATNINASLSALSLVFTNIANRSGHVPYRNSMLTKLLQPALSGTGKTLMIVNLSPEESSFTESLSSLRFARQVSQCEVGPAKKFVKTAIEGSPRVSAGKSSQKKSAGGK